MFLNIRSMAVCTDNTHLHIVLKVLRFLSRNLFSELEIMRTLENGTEVIIHLF